MRWRQKNILSFQITMENIFWMKILKILRVVILENSFFVSTENYGTCNAMHIWTSHSTRFCSSRKSCFWRRYLFRSPPSQNAMTIIKLPSLLSNESWYPTMFGCFKVFSKSTSNWAAFLSLVEYKLISRKIKKYSTAALDHPVLGPSGSGASIPVPVWAE